MSQQGFGREACPFGSSRMCKSRSLAAVSCAAREAWYELYYSLKNGAVVYVMCAHVLT